MQAQYNSALGPPPTYENGSQYVVGGPAVIAVQPALTGGLFLDPDPPILVSATTDTSPRGALDYLRRISTLNVKQKIEMIEVLTDFDTQNRFTIYDDTGRPVFYALEDSNFCVRQCCGPRRPFEMKILDIFQNEIIHITRPLACQSCCFFCCLMSVDVTSPPGVPAGKIQQTCSLLTPTFAVLNEVGETVLKIKGPCWTCSCGGDVVFKVLSKDGETEVGKISKKWSGFVQEYFTDADSFQITFPEDLDVKVKATLIGALFLIDVMYFEKKKR